jgi:carboxylesterase
MQKTGCLLIHGFGGSPDEVAPLGEFLQQRGIEVHMPQLKGHTGRWTDLSRANYRDWIESTELGLKELKTRCDNVIVVGFSMGGLLTIQLSSKYELTGIILMNMPVYYWNVRQMAINVFGDIRLGRYDNIIRYIRSSVSLPPQAMVNFKVLLHKTTRLIPDISCPVMICQAMDDDAVQWRSARYIFDTVASPVKSVRYYNDAGHQICQSLAASQLFEDTILFIDSLSKAK